MMRGDSATTNRRDAQLVMDVALKRDYAEGWLGNADVAADTRDRFLARIFAMRYTDHSGLFVYGGTNNLNKRLIERLIPALGRNR